MTEKCIQFVRSAASTLIAVSVETPHLAVWGVHFCIMIVLAMRCSKRPAFAICRTYYACTRASLRQPHDIEHQTRACDAATNLAIQELSKRAAAPSTMGGCSMWAMWLSGSMAIVSAQYSAAASDRPGSCRSCLSRSACGYALLRQSIHQHQPLIQAPYSSSPELMHSRIVPAGTLQFMYAVRGRKKSDIYLVHQQSQQAGIESTCYI